MNQFGRYLCRDAAHFEANRSNAVDGDGDDVDDDLYERDPPREESSATNTVMSSGESAQRTVPSNA